MKKIYLLLITLLFLVIGYASINTILNITGILKLSSSEFTVRIKNTIMNNNDISGIAINEAGNEFKVTLNDTNIISYDIVNESREYDALVYFSCNSIKAPDTSIDWYLSDNYIKANGTSRGQVGLYFSNEEIYDQIRQINARINELMFQYEQETSTEYDRESIMYEVNDLNREKERLYKMIIEEDTLTCKMELKAIEKTKVDLADNVMDDVKFVTATENDKDVSKYISDDGKYIDFSSTKDTQIFFDVTNTNETYASSVYVRCTSTSSPNSHLYFGMDNDYAKPGETVSGDILLELNQDEIRSILADIDARKEELQYHYEFIENDWDKEAIQQELGQLEEERRRIESLYVESDSVSCELIVEHIELIPESDEDKVSIEFANIKKNDESLPNGVLSDDKKKITIEVEDYNKIFFELINKTPTHDTQINLYCESKNEETVTFYYLTNSYIKSKGSSEGVVQVQLNNRFILQDIESLDSEETFLLNILEKYQISDEYKEYIVGRLADIASQREELYKRMVDKDIITCEASVINYE